VNPWPGFPSPKTHNFVAVKIMDNWTKVDLYEKYFFVAFFTLHNNIDNKL
jgi:hypothetical protein